MTAEDFFKLGNLVKDIRDSLFEALSLATKPITKKEQRYLSDAIDKLDRFKHLAEEEMFDHYGADSNVDRNGIKVFYGEGWRVNLEDGSLYEVEKPQ